MILPENIDKIILYRERNFFLSSIKPINPANKTVRRKIRISLKNPGKNIIKKINPDLSL